MYKYLIALLLLTTTVMNFRVLSQTSKNPQWNMLPKVQNMKGGDNDIMEDDGQGDEDMELPDELDGDAMNEEEIMKNLMKIPTNGKKMMSKNAIWKGLNRRISKSNFSKLVRKISKKHRTGRKYYKKYRRGCRNNNWKYPNRCPKHNYCCYYVSTRYIIHYLYKIFYYARNKYGCRMAKLYVSRLLHKLIKKLPNWYKKYYYKKLVRVIYSWRC